MKKAITILCILVNCIACNIKKNDLLNEHKDFNSTIIIRSPGQCVQKITINSDGQINYIVGGVTSYKYDKDFVDFDYIKNQFQFKLKSNQDIKYINDKIYSFKDSNIISGHKKDALRFEFFINHKKKIDVYGRVPENLSNILSTLKENIPEDVDYACG